jgi:uncharacterized protein with HEPN domain
LEFSTNAFVFKIAIIGENIKNLKFNENALSSFIRPWIKMIRQLINSDKPITTENQSN